LPPTALLRATQILQKESKLLFHNLQISFAAFFEAVFVGVLAFLGLAAFGFTAFFGLAAGFYLGIKSFVEQYTSLK
jgi:hypothetical protein